MNDNTADVSRRDFIKSGCAFALGLGITGMMRTGAPSGATAPKAEKTDAKPAAGASGTGFVYDEKYAGFLQPGMGARHPESPERLKAIMKRLQESGLDKKLKRIKPKGDPMPFIKLIHPESHIRRVAEQTDDEATCRLAAAGALCAVDAVFKGEVRNAFCAIRPPGHHATDFGEFGFCFYNNIAVAAKYAREKHGAKKVAIVDWDFHHGNGTEWAFYDDPSVLFFSTHALYAFPGTGFPDRTGEGEKKGLNINVPLPRGAGDEEILGAFNDILAPAAEKFKPDFVLISAGFDSRHDDLLGNFQVTDEGFAKLTKLMMSIAEKHARSRLVSVLEGGYNVDGLALAVESHLNAMLGA